MPKRSRSKYNWPKIKQVYIAGKHNTGTGESEDYTYTELAAMFNVKSDTSVLKRAKKEGWDTEREKRKKKDEAVFAKKLQEMKDAELPDVIELRQKGLKTALGTVSAYLKALNAGEVEVKPNEALKAFDFLIEQYHFIFGIPQQQPTPDTTDEPAIQINIGNRNDLYNIANKLRNGS